jgi:hypothetical protein
VEETFSFLFFSSVLSVLLVFRLGELCNLLFMYDTMNLGDPLSRRRKRGEASKRSGASATRVTESKAFSATKDPSEGKGKIRCYAVRKEQDGIT